MKDRRIPCPAIFQMYWRIYHSRALSMIIAVAMVVELLLALSLVLLTPQGPLLEFASAGFKVFGLALVLLFLFSSVKGSLVFQYLSRGC